jgi:hypothetical protein
MYGIDIDGIPGDAKFMVLKEPLKYMFVFVTSVLGDVYLESEYYENVDDVLDKFEELVTYKFVGENSKISFVSSKEYEQQKILYMYFCEIQKRELEECYVCHDPTYGHQTLCGHYICPHCYYKSLKDCNYDLDENGGECGKKNTKFVCGICRSTINTCEIHKFY